MQTFTDKFDNFVVPNFATPEECRRLVEASEATSNRHRATVGSDRRTDAKVRNNTTAFLAKEDSGDMVERVSALLEKQRPGVDASLCEGVQVQIYEPGEHYTKHTDSWRNDVLCPDTVSGWLPGKKHHPLPRQRTWTCVLYLNDVEEGGTTTFPKAGAVVSPELGKLACWNNVHPDLSANVMTEHQGDDVIKGKKWLANFWFNTEDGPPCMMKQRASVPFGLDRDVWIAIGISAVVLVVAALLLFIRTLRE